MNTIYTTEWQAREHKRLMTGEYEEIPATIYAALFQAGVNVPLVHYLHVSKYQPGMVAYTENNRMGEADRQTRVKFGKYLGKYFKHLTVPQIAAFSAMLRGEMSEYELRIARTAEEIVEVYENGPHSCMAHETSEYASYPHHPVEVYASPDTAVGYLMRDGRITARTVLNMKDKQYIRVYGDEHNMIPVLESAGFSYGDLDGCRLTYLENNHGAVVCPYLDSNADYVSEHRDSDGHWLIVGHSGDWYGCSHTNGLVQESTRCSCCGDYVSDDDVAYVESEDDYVCESCIDYHYISVITEWRYESTEWFHENNLDYCVELPDGRYCTDYAFDNQEEYVRDGDGEVHSVDDCVFCELDGEWWHVDDTTDYVDSDGETQYLHNSDSDKLVEDAVTGDRILLEDAVECAHGHVRAA